MANEVDIRLINGRKLQDIDLRKNFDNFKSDTNNKLEELRDITDPFRVDIKLEPSVAEIGSKIDVELSWSYNRDIIYQSVNRGDVIPGDRNMTLHGLYQDETFNIEGRTLDGKTTSNFATIYFCNGIYYGASTTYRFFDSEFIKGLDYKVLSNDRERIITINPITAGYIYYCVPSRLGKCYFSIDFELISTIDFTNDSNYTEKYDIYRTPITSLTVQTIKVKGYYDAEDLLDDLDDIKEDIDNVKSFSLTCEIVDDRTEEVLDENYEIKILKGE